MEVRSYLAELRAKRGIGAAELAARVGISRQTVYAIEAGTYVPNTVVSLKLASALETTVEELFRMDSADSGQDEIAEATVLGGADALKPGQPLRLCDVEGRLVAVAPEPGGLSLPPADAFLIKPIRKGKDGVNASVRVLGDKWKKTPRLLLAGCDPSASILAQAMQSHGCELVVAYENSSRSLELLRDGLVHLAGTHLVESASKTSLAPITRMFSRDAIAIFSYAIWEEGLLTAKGNPKRIEGVADLSRKDVRFTNREPGAGSRRLLDDMLRKQGIPARQISGYDRITVGHMPSARLVYSGEVDCCINTKAMAHALSLHFISLAEKPYHLVVHRDQLKSPPMQTLLDVMGRAAFRREVEAYAGYNMRTCGDQLYP